jgi:DNA polymerase-3 subunit chi
MTSIDFHFNTPDRLEYACRLTRKIVNAGQANAAAPLVVFCQDEARLQQFDDLLWQFSPTDFIPHVRAPDPLAKDTPVLLTADDARLPVHHLLLNLDDAPPPFFSRYVRLLEVVSLLDDDKLKARERFTFYRDRGYAMTRHDLSKT